MQTDRVKFPRDTDVEFTKTLNARVNAYFKDNGISKHANTTMIVKTIIIVAAYIIPLGLMLGGIITTSAGVIGCYFLMGFAIAGIGMAVMHDANHGA